MKELEKTKRISIASVLFILIVLIGLLSYKRPKHLYSLDPSLALNEVAANNFLVNQNELSKISHQLIDIRSQYEFDKGHLENALNIYTPEILNEKNSIVLKQLMNEDKTIVLYGANPNEALLAYMTLFQVGIKNIKVLLVENSYEQNKLISKNVVIEKSLYDITGFINESVKKAAQKPKPVVKKTIPKKVVPVKKKKKMPVEGGC